MRINDKQKAYYLRKYPKKDAAPAVDQPQPVAMDITVNPEGPGTDTSVLNSMASFMPEAAGNYIGPGWSDGKFQSSVEWGSSEPQSELDLEAYYHDSAYKKFSDEAHRQAADSIFADNAARIKGELPPLARTAVSQGNMLSRSVTRTTRNVASGAALAGVPGAIIGLVYTGLQNLAMANDLLPGKTRDNLRKEVLDYYASDPNARSNNYVTKPSSKTSAKDAGGSKPPVLRRTEVHEPTKTIAQLVKPVSGLSALIKKRRNKNGASKQVVLTPVKRKTNRVRRKNKQNKKKRRR